MQIKGLTMSKILIVFLAFFSSLSFSQTCSKKGTTIIFVNGSAISSDINEQNDKLYEIQRNHFEMIFKTLGKNALDQKGQVFLESVYNAPSSIPLLGEQLDSIFLYVNDKMSVITKNLGISNAQLIGKYVYGGITKEEEERIKNLVGEVTYKIFLNLFKSYVSISQPDLLKLTNKVKENLSRDKKVITLAYSQATILDNEVYDVILSSDLRETIDVYGSTHLANTAATLRNPRSRYITSDRDVVANTLGLPANFTIVSDNDSRFDPFDHFFLETYTSLDVYADEIHLGNPVITGHNMAENMYLSVKEVTKKLGSNCEDDDYLPDVEYSANFSNLFGPTVLDATARIDALTKLEKADFVKIRWEVGGTVTTSEDTTKDVYLSTERTYPSKAKIYLNNGKTYAIDFSVDLTSYVGGPILVKQLELQANEGISATAMDHGRNLFLLATTQGRLISMNQDSGEIVETKNFINNVMKMEVNQLGKLMVVYMNDLGKYVFSVRDFKTLGSSFDKILEDSAINYDDWAFDKKNNIFYYSFFSGKFDTNPSNGESRRFDTLVAVGGKNGVELARGDYLVGSYIGDRSSSLIQPSFVNRDGQLLRMGASMYWDEMFMPVFDYTFSAAYNPTTMQLEMSYYSEFYGTSGIVQMDNRKNLTYAYMHKHGSIGSGRFTAIDSRTRNMIYSQEPGAVSFLQLPQIARSGHFMGIKMQCADTCSYGVHRLLRTDDLTPPPVVQPPEVPVTPPEEQPQDPTSPPLS